MFYVRAIVTIIAAAAFVLPSVATASAAPASGGATVTSVSTSDAMTPDDTPWN